MRLLSRMVPWIIILSPFPILAVLYNSLPSEMVIFRHFDGAHDYAPRSLFTVFRVPLIEVTCALAIEIMRWRAIAEGYFRIWAVLLWTVAIKTMLQTVETLSPSDQGPAFFFLTASAVLIGIAVAAAVALAARSSLNRENWKVSNLEKAALLVLVAGYLVLAFGPSFLGFM